MYWALCVKRSCLSFAALFLSIHLYGHSFDRLVILTQGDRDNPALHAQIAKLETDFRHYFGVQDIKVITVRKQADAERSAEDTALTLEEGLLNMQEQCQDPNTSVILALVFTEDQGPSLSQVNHMLEKTSARITFLSNAYFKSALADLGCGRHAILDYSRGEVRARDTIVTDDSHFPIIPVVIGTAVVGTGIVLLSKGDKSGCTTVDPSWQIPTGLCSDQAPVQVSITGTQGGTWSGNGISTNGMFDPSSGTQSITYSVGEGECRQSRVQTIEVGSANASWSFPSSPCEGQSLVLTPSVSGGTWSGAGITQNPNGTATFIQSDAGNYNVSYSITQSGCSATINHDIQVLPDANPSWAIPSSPCAGQFIDLIPTGTTGGQWTGDGVTDHGDGTASFGSNTAGSFNITYTAGSGECVASLTQQIEVMPNPDASWTGPKTPGCAGQQFLLIPSGTPGGTWSGTGVTDQGDGTGIFSHSEAGTYAITYTVILGNCTSMETQNITVISNADPSWMNPGDLCSGQVQILVPTGTPGGTWSGTGISDQGNGTAIFISNEAGIFSITYTAGTGECEASSTMDITVIQSPDASWSPPQNALCTGDAFELIPAGTGGGMWAGTGVTDHGNGTATFTQSKAGAFDITYSVTTGPCSASSTNTINVISQPDPSWTIPLEVCTGDQITLTPSGTPGGVWSGTNITDLGDGTALFNPSEAGTYNIIYTIGQGACEASLAQDVEVNALPDASWDIPTGVCTGQSVTLIPSGIQGGIWTGEGVTDLGNGNADFVQNKSGFYVVTYTVTSGPCTSSLTQSIEVMSQPDPSWTPPVDVCSGQQVLLFPDGTMGGTWSGPGITDLGNGTAHFMQSEGGTYLITYSIGQGACEQLLAQDIVVNDAGDPSWNPPSDVICPGVVVDLVANEGTWSGNGVTDLGGGLGQFQAFNPGTYSITHTVGSGNCIASETHDVEVGDFEDPVIDIPASDMNVTCDGSGNMQELQDWLDSNGGAEASDNCSGGVTWENDFTDLPLDCGMAGSVTVTFTATDEEGNTATTIGTFTVEDQEPPVLEGVPSDITTSCDNVPPPENVTSFDECSGNLDVVFEELPPGTDCPYEIVRTWTSTDACGNEVTAQQTITATDDQPPEPQTIPHDTIINCPGPPEQCIPPPQEVQFTDNCDSDPTVQMNEEIQQMPGMIIIIRCWSATDDCGNMSPPICQQIHIFGEGGNVQQQVLEISFTVAQVPEVPHNLHTLFIPANSLWKDPGLSFGPHDLSGEVVTITRVPPIRLGLELQLEPRLSLVAGGGFHQAELFRRFQNPQNDYMLSGLLDQQTLYLGLRFTPEKMKNVYFITGAKYFRYDISDIRLHHNHYVTFASNEISDFSFTQFIGTGVRFEIGDIGHLNIASSYSQAVSTTLSMQLELNINRLVSHAQNFDKMKQ